MKRRGLISHLIKEGCILYREGAQHSVFLNPENGHIATVPRHRELEALLARKTGRYVGNWIFPSPRQETSHI